MSINMSTSRCCSLARISVACPKRRTPIGTPVRARVTTTFVWCVLLAPLQWFHTLSLS